MRNDSGLPKPIVSISTVFNANVCKKWSDHCEKKCLAREPSEHMNYLVCDKNGDNVNGTSNSIQSDDSGDVLHSVPIRSDENLLFHECIESVATDSNESVDCNESVDSGVMYTITNFESGITHANIHMQEQNISPDTCENSSSVVSEQIPFPKLDKFRASFQKNFIFAHLNINGLSSKYSEIYEILRSGYIDFLAIGESKLYPELQMSFKVNNFTFYRRDRLNVSERNAGGGLAAYVSSVIPHRFRKDISFNQDGIEDMVFEIVMKKQKWFIVIVYRPPSISVNALKEAISYLYSRCENEGHHTIVLGDLNVNFSHENNPLSDEMEIFNLKNVVEGPTCFKSQTNPSAVDVILTNNPRRIISSLNVDVGLSDHHTMILAAAKMHAPKVDKKVIYYNSFKNFHAEDYLTDLACAPFQTGLIFDDLDDHVWYHNTLLKDVISKHAPKKKRIIKSRQLVYMNGELRRAINVKAMLKRKMNKIPSKENIDKFRFQRNHVTKLKRKSLKSYFDKKCSKDAMCQNPGEFWKTVKPFLGEPHRGTSEINLCENGEVITDSSEVCNILNDYYIKMTDSFSITETVSSSSSIGEIAEAYKDHPSIIKIKEKVTSDLPFNFKEISYDDLHSKLKNIKGNKATGFDDIPPRLVKAGASVLAYTFLPVINSGMKCNQFPNDLKCGDITPIFKKDDPLNKEKYRPVNVLPSFSKPFENIMFDQMMKFFENILSPSLSAYRKGYSTQHVLVKAIEDTKKSLDKNEHVGWVLMDLSKAFDALPHGLLIAKLKAYGLSESACRLICSYLSSRKQRVKLGSTKSNWQLLKRGVPQGSVMGPLLFNIFKNDIFYFLEGHCNLYNYADDDTISQSDHDISRLEQKLSFSSVKAVEWFKNNGMQANAPKFQVAFFTRSEDLKQIQVKINQVILESQPSVKLLGVTVDAKFSFSEHISNICKKAAVQVNGLRRLSIYLSQKTMFNIYVAFIVSNFLYCPLTWHFCSKINTKKMEKVQERALRIILRDVQNDYKMLLENSKRNSFHLMRLKLIAIEMFKVTNGMTPIFLQELFTKKQHFYSVRNNITLKLPAYNTITYGKNNLSYYGALLWNNIDMKYKNVNCLNEFKQLISQWPGPACNCGFCMICMF